MTTGLVWFRRDLRLDDNPAWASATAAHEQVVALFVLDERILGAVGEHRRAQLFAELAELDRRLRECGGALTLRRGDPAVVVPAVATEARVQAVHWNLDVAPWAIARDRAVRQRLSAEVVTAHGTLVLAPGSVLTAQGTVHQVFSAFHRRWLATAWEPWPTEGVAEVVALPGEALAPSSSPVPAGEDAAHDALAAFLTDEVEGSPASRDDLAGPGGSGLSVALHFGTISPRRVVEAAGGGGSGREAYIRQLAWRDWFAHLLAERPDMVDHPVRDQYASVAWRDDPDEIQAWKEGRTGFPLVDAAMRELTRTGRMHNRARMVAASFLVKDLLVDWRIGERHYRRLLLDGDVAQNVGNWQWVAGTGPDAAPYFRVFNPLTQSRTHDPRGVYLRRWLPELAGLDDDEIHEPGSAGPLALAAAGVSLGVDYPDPIVDHRDARLRAIAAYKQARIG